MGENAINKGQSIICPVCHKEHFTEEFFMDEYINCECGFSFYAFVDRDLRIIMTQGEASYEPVARAMRRFVVSTGRCLDIPYELYCDPSDAQAVRMQVQEKDLDERLMDVLDEYQQAAFGECFMTKDLIDAICESLQHGKDIELKKQKDSVQVLEKKVKNITRDAAERQRARMLAYGDKLLMKGPASRVVGRGVMMGNPAVTQGGYDKTVQQRHLIYQR